MTRTGPRCFDREVRNGTIRNVTEFRDVSKVARAERVEADTTKAEFALRRLFDRNNYSIENAYADSVSNAYSERDLLGYVKGLTERLGKISPHELRVPEIRKAIEELYSKLIEILGRKGSSFRSLPEQLRPCADAVAEFFDDTMGLGHLKVEEEADKRLEYRPTLHSLTRDKYLVCIEVKEGPFSSSLEAVVSDCMQQSLPVKLFVAFFTAPNIPDYKRNIRIAPEKRGWV